jgi:hypothetical protein
VSTKQHAEDSLVFALASGATVEDAAERCAIDVKTVRRKLADATFRERVRAARAELTERACGLLTAAGLEAVQVLSRLMAGGPPAVRLSAAKAVLDLGVKLREVVDLEAQVADLERRVDEREADRPPGHPPGVRNTPR